MYMKAIKLAEETAYWLKISLCEARSKMS